MGSLSVLWLLVFVSSQKSVKIRLWYKCYFSVDNDFAVDIPAGHSLFPSVILLTEMCTLT